MWLIVTYNSNYFLLVSSVWNQIDFSISVGHSWILARIDRISSSIGDQGEFDGVAGDLQGTLCSRMRVAGGEKWATRERTMGDLWGSFQPIFFSRNGTIIVAKAALVYFTSPWNSIVTVSNVDLFFNLEPCHLQEINGSRWCRSFAVFLMLSQSK